jgi:hypothetical protein
VNPLVVGAKQPLAERAAVDGHAVAVARHALGEMRPDEAAAYDQGCGYRRIPRNRWGELVADTPRV